jgi:iron complex outermembrane receptor protein
MLYIKKLLLLVFLPGFILVSNLRAEVADSIIYLQADTLRYETDNVVITGTRVNKKIIDIPYSVYQIKNSNFIFNRKIGINEALETVPGLFMQSRYGNHDVRIAIRGFGSRSNSGIRGVRILLDDIPESEPDGQTRIEAIDFNSIGKIEVVKGNSSSLYTNAPGGVVNFINDMEFQNSFASVFNEFGSFGLRRNGFKSGIRTENYGLLITYGYHNFNGYRDHNNDYWHILNAVLETKPSENTNLKILGYFVDGVIKLPGSLTKEKFEADPFQPEQRQIDRDSRRETTKGRVGIRFNALFGPGLNQEFEITSYGTIKHFQRPSKYFKIIDRFGLGVSTKYVFRSVIAGFKNEFSAGGDAFIQPAVIEEYDNINGQKGDNLNSLTSENIKNSGFYISNNLELLQDKLLMLITARFDYVAFIADNQLLAVQNDLRTFEDFTPKIAFNYKFTPSLAVYTSFGLAFDSPAGNELDNYPLSSHPGKIYNPDLEPQKSKNFELGVKGNLINRERVFIRNILFDASFFHIVVDNEIIPFVVGNEVYFRNAAQTTRFGIELGTEIELLRGLNFNIAYTYSNFKYDTYSALTIDEEFTPSEQNYSGNIVPSVPEHNAFISLAYARQITNSITGFVKSSFLGVSGLWVDDANTDKTDGYTVYNALIGFDIILGRFSILASAGVNNIFDKLYVGFTNTNSTDGLYYEPGELRNYFGGINFGYRF